MEEVLKLKLNADWVVLSACNTGAANGAGAEAVSGLGQSFFYAGTRAILVSMWPVETTSAKKLTTRLFQYQKEDKTLSRAGAHQKSMLKLIDDPGLKDRARTLHIVSLSCPSPYLLQASHHLPPTRRLELDDPLACPSFHSSWDGVA